MMDFYKALCADDIGCVDGRGAAVAWDPMLGEAADMCQRMVSRPLSFSLSPPFPPEIQGSPDYTPVSALWSKVANLNEEATAMGYNHVVQFGPGVQLTQEVNGQLRETTVTEQVAEMMLEERRNSIVESMFVPCEQPRLEAPQMSKAKGKTRPAKAATKEPTRRSTRQQVSANSVPVSKRATQRLIRAFDIAGPSEPVGEEAMEAYIRSYDAPMTEQRIKAIRMLTSLDSGPALAAAAQLAAEQEMTEAEEVAA
jgi:hypothetical protein